MNTNKSFGLKKSNNLSKVDIVISFEFLLTTSNLDVPRGFFGLLAIKLSGKKESKKDYFKHTNYPGGAKNISIKVMREKKPEFILMNSIKGMLPHNRLGKKILTHLKVYASNEHPHLSQKPIKLEL